MLNIGVKERLKTNNELQLFCSFKALKLNAKINEWYIKGKFKSTFKL